LIPIGVGSAINRSFAVLEGQPLIPPPVSQLSKVVIQQMQRYDDEFLDHPVSTLLHIIGGSVFLILALCQFSNRIRERHLQFHRWSGRILIVVGIVGTLAALFLAIPFRFTGMLASSAIIIFGLVFLIALLRAFVLIRHHDVTRHREWMIRAYSIAIGISTVRIFGAAFMLGTHTMSWDSMGYSFWIGWTLTLCVSEAWIRFTRLHAFTKTAV
jgi:Predicted membrane protein (DUF2306)